MSKPTHLHPADVHGVARLAADATHAVTDIVEAMHASLAWPLLPAPLRPTPSSLSLPGLVYSSVRGVTRLVGGGIDLALSPLVPLLGEKVSTPERDTMISVLNGVIGDHLEATDNPLAIPMELRRRGRPLTLTRGALATSLPRRSKRIAVLIHGLCGTDAQWKRADVDYGMALERDHGFTPLYLRYNSGLHVSTNGRRLAALLDQMLGEWPGDVDEVLLVGHSMGGLVARSAIHYGTTSGHAWPGKIRRMAFLGTPHHGAPLERGGHWFEQVVGSLPFAAPLSRLGRLRSAGVTDLRHGNLVDEDWQHSDRFAHADDRRVAVALPAGIDCFAVAATTGSTPGDLRDRFFVGDGLVPLRSALGHHDDPARELGIDASRRAVLLRASHMSLLGHPEAWDHLTRWLAN